MTPVPATNAPPAAPAITAPRAGRCGSRSPSWRAPASTTASACSDKVRVVDLPGGHPAVTLDQLDAGHGHRGPLRSRDRHTLLAPLLLGTGAAGADTVV